MPPLIDLGELWTNPAETVKLWSWLKLWGLTQPRWLFPKCVVAKSSFNRQGFLFENMLNTTGWSKFVNSTGNWCKTEIWGWYAGSKWYKLSFFGRYRLRYLWVLPIYLQKIQLPWTWLTGYWSWGVPCRSFSGLVVGLNSQVILLATTVNGRHPAPLNMKPCK